MGNMLFWLIFFTPGWTLSDGSEMEQDFTWHLSEVPRIVGESTSHLSGPWLEADSQVVTSRRCGIECQRERPAPSLPELEDSLSYETVYENGSRTLTRVRVRGLVPGPAPNGTARGAPARRRRQVYGTDSRFSILDARFLTSFPFSTAVKLSTGCSGVLVSPSHALTAAHCVHDGQGYVRGSKRLRVGLLRMRRNGRGGGRRGSRRSRRGARGGDRGGGAARAVRGRGQGGGAGRGAGRAAGSPSFRWTRVRRTYIPAGWARGGRGEPGLDYDYALLELKRAHGGRYMELGVSPAIRRVPGGRIHFSGFDADRPDQLVYRFCGVSDESSDLLYQYCDAEAGSAGSGVYLRLKEPDKKTWKRRVVAVYAGHQRVDVRGEQKDYNVAVRVTPLKFAQICLWIRGNDADCARG